MIALIDSDLILYKTCNAVAHEVDWGNGLRTEWIFEEEAKKLFRDQLHSLLKDLDVYDYALCLTDLNRNFRHDLLPEYKSGRSKRPVGWHWLRAYVEETYECIWRPGLEADDVMGIMATGNIRGMPPVDQRIIVSEDKDMLTVPGKLFRRGMLIEIDEDEAERSWLFQVLAGDPTDGYKGCPGCGATRAEEILTAPTALVEYEHVYKRGPRKGQTEWRWKDGDPCDIWTAIVAEYKKAGLDEEDAIVQARVAKILTADYYDFENKEVILWTPRHLTAK